MEIFKNPLPLPTFSSITNITFDDGNLLNKFTFLLLICLLFVIALKLGISMFGYLLSPDYSPHLIDGMVDASQQLVFKQNPNKPGSVTIYRSVNQDKGIEFTWSVWILIRNLDTKTSEYKHIFSKGNNSLDETGKMSPNNAPGLYISPETNELTVIMNTYDVINEEIKIPDIPINKWINVIIRCENDYLDIYINGVITRSITMTGVPKQNYGDVYVAMNGGFNGFISNLWYYNRALNIGEIQGIMLHGPSTNMIGGSIIPQATGKNAYDYLALRWFF